ncbi:hypothetical protein [Halalkalibacter krulwichiae]|uniref:Uncharacterized protein n=1 Tax=Halalkalibacter krulwichiae TaxID=199441 RepID=A0A1X9MB49_9BACI|nr:hypothetical protein [Halalkalibacter krulwichiae]ARK30647.1 hypothetical protein BkAM31D_12865 [Halalkalibacter krulwichiae]
MRVITKILAALKENIENKDSMYFTMMHSKAIGYSQFCTDYRSKGDER